MSQQIIKKHRVTIHGNEASVGGAAGNSARHGSASGRDQKTLRFLEEEGVIHAIEVTCSCGESTLIELQYPAENAAHNG